MCVREREREIVETGERRKSESVRERERESVDKASMIATINTSCVELLPRVVLAFYYVFHATGDKMHRELTML